MRRAMHRALAVVGALLSLPGGARADARPTLLADHAPGAPGTTLEVELGWYTDSAATTTIHALAPLVGFRHAFSDAAELEVDWPFAFIDVSSDLGPGESSFVTGNPFLAGYYVDRSPHGYFRVGGGIAPPLASVDPNGTGADLVAYSAGIGMRGGWDSWLYLFDHLTLVVPFQGEVDSHGLVLGGDAALAYAISTDQQVDNENDLVLQFAGTIGGRAGVVTAGGKLQVFWVPTSNNTDNAQIALVPFVQADFEDGGLCYVRFTLNLDEPLGVFGNGGDAWGLFLGGGARF